MIEIYDKAKYHYEGEFPAGLVKEQAYVHTGLFLGWAVENGLISGQFQDDFSGDIEDFLQHKITGPRLYAIAGGVFDSTMLNNDGNSFARYYFDFEKGNFVGDYQVLLAAGLPSFFHVSDSWSNYSRLSNRINQRFDEWKVNRNLVQ